ncbi:MAG: hypothetical protein LBE13_21385 [Bacteroidales bacterium]|jgi:hypothetical protein|nr:hypothetical protein [Bacteroidales bacterium]
MSNLKKVEEKNELHSLNGQLYNEFFIQELESRLETDPLMVGGFIDSMAPSAADCFNCNLCFNCGEFL